jgi:hypothetical protein
MRKKRKRKGELLGKPLFPTCRSSNLSRAGGTTLFSPSLFFALFVPFHGYFVSSVLPLRLGVSFPSVCGGVNE